MGCIVHWWGSVNLYVTGDITWAIEKGLWCLGASFTDPYGRARFLASSYTFCLCWNMFVEGDLLLAAALRAFVTCILCCLNWLTLNSMVGLSVPIDWSGVIVGSHPLSSWLGMRLVVAFCVLLCTKVARGSIVDQSSWLVKIRQRNCSTHWFFCSVSPLV